VGGHVACVEEMVYAHKILVRKTERMKPLGRLGVDEKIMLGKQGGKVWTGFICLRIRTNGGLL